MRVSKAWLPVVLLQLGACAIPPRILEVEGPPDTLDTVGPYRVTAAVTGAEGIRDLSVIWTTTNFQPDAGMITGEPQRAVMRAVGSSGYEGILDGQPHGTRVEYVLHLTQQTGERQTAQGDGGSFSFRVLQADGGFP